jgi:hypothetical protein
MADQRITDTGYDQEDAYFHQKDAAERRPVVRVGSPLWPTCAIANVTPLLPAYAP